jgi:hypothetical protein
MGSSIMIVRRRPVDATGGGGQLLRGALVTLVTLAVTAVPPPAGAIDVKLTMEDAKKALAAGREQMLTAADASNPEESIKKLMKQVSMTTWVGADPEKDPCGLSALLKTKRYWLGHFGRIEARESKKQKQDVRMPEEKVKQLIDTPYLEVEFHLCGEDEFFAEGVEVAFQQGSKTIRPTDLSPPKKASKAPDQNHYRALFNGRFPYDSFDPDAKTKVVIFYPDGKMDEIEADFSKVK